MEDFELVRDADNFAWTNLQDGPLALGAKGLTTSSAVKGKKRGAFRRAPGTETYFDEDAEVSVVAIEVSAAEKNDERGTRAVWEGQMPKAKHIQMELSWESSTGEGRCRKGGPGGDLGTASGV